jgi:uncharacterized membrane protein YvbJ
VVTCAHGHPNSELSRFCAQCGTALGTTSAQHDVTVRQDAVAAGQSQTATGGEPGFRGFWLGLTDSARGWLVIAAIAAVIVLVILVATHRESSQPAAPQSPPPTWTAPPTWTWSQTWSMTVAPNPNPPIPGWG